MEASRDVEGYGAMVASPHHLSTTAGIEILARGGSAVDAAIAVDAVQGVVAPETCGIGGDLFALVAEPGIDIPSCLNSSGPAGSGADAELLRAAGHERMPDLHPSTVTVPGCVAGWYALHERHGRLEMAEVLAPAIRLASTGFAASRELSSSFTKAESDLAGQPAAAGLYPDGRAPAPGTRVARPGLAATLARIAGEGPAAFYTGEVAAAVVEALAGTMEPGDLASYRPAWVEPLSLDVFGLTGWTIPPNSQGYLTLASAAIFEGLARAQAGEDERTHLLVESYRAVAWERDDVVADPADAPLTGDRLLDRDRLAARAASIDPDRASVWPAPRAAPGGTAYMCVIDGDGLAISLIQSNFMGIGSRIGAGEAGFFLHNRGAGFDLRPGHPNELRPGRRPLHTLSPTLWTEDGELRALLGTRGGHQQPQLMLQLADALFGRGDPPDIAQRRPRWTTDQIGAGSDPALEVEARMPGEVIAGLERRGHRVTIADDLVGGWGPVSVILTDTDGLRRGAPDPRVDTTSVQVR